VNTVRSVNCQKTSICKHKR